MGLSPRGAACKSRAFHSDERRAEIHAYLSGVELDFGMIPNLITLCRLALVPFVIAMMSKGEFRAAFFGFMLAGFSDAIDGYIARRFDMRTELGAYLDAIADKVLLTSIFVTLSITGQIPGWLAIIVVSRDIAIVGGILLAAFIGAPMEIKPNRLSKLNTVFQIIFAGTVLGARAFGLDIEFAIDNAEYLVAALTIASTVAYLVQWLKHLEGEIDA